MSGLWIRVNARLADDKDVRAFARALLPDVPTWMAVSCACGLLATLWGRCIDDQEDGIVSGVDDDALEEWAKWRGEPGKFAALFRERFVEKDGKIVLWDEYQGTLIARRAYDRWRKGGRKGPRPSAGVPAESDDIPQEPPREHPPERPAAVQRISMCNGDGDGNGDDSSPTGEKSFDAVDALLAMIPANARAAWSAEISVAKQGMHGPILTEAQVQHACREYIGDGHVGGQRDPVLRHFRAYLSNVGAKKEPPPVGASSSNGSGAGDADKAFAKIRGMVQSTPVPGRPPRRFIPKADVEALGRRAFLAYERIGGAERFTDEEAKVEFLLRDFKIAWKNISREDAGE